MRYRCLVRIGGGDLLRWGDADPAATLNSLLAALGRLLQPGLGDSAAIFVGPALLLLLQKMPSAVQPVIPQVRNMCAIKHESAGRLPLLSDPSLRHSAVALTLK